jgi:protein gp37
MAETKIEWTHRRHPRTGTVIPGYTFNAWIGCTKWSPACELCYAKDLDDMRFSRNPATGGGTPTAPVSHWGKGAPRYRTKDWAKPRRWNREAGAEGFARACFTCSLADWADAEVNPEWLADLLNLIRETSNLDWLMLTKRAPRPALERARDWIIARERKTSEEVLTLGWLNLWLGGHPPGNVWLGATMENQAMLDRRLPELLDVAAVVHFASMEPLLGPVVIPETVFRSCDTAPLFHTLDWVISGGESCSHDKAKARPVHPDDALAIARQCWANDIPFFWKQWGEWAPAYELDHNPQAQAMCAMGKVQAHDFGRGEGGRRFSYLVGVDMAGNTFDGRKCNAMPTIRELTNPEPARTVAIKTKRS